MIFFIRFLCLSLAITTFHLSSTLEAAKFARGTVEQSSHLQRLQGKAKLVTGVKEGDPSTLFVLYENKGLRKTKTLYELRLVVNSEGVTVVQPYKISKKGKATFVPHLPWFAFNPKARHPQGALYPARIQPSFSLAPSNKKEPLTVYTTIQDGRPVWDEFQTAPTPPASPRAGGGRRVTPVGGHPGEGAHTAAAVSSATDGSPAVVALDSESNLQALHSGEDFRVLNRRTKAYEDLMSRQDEQPLSIAIKGGEAGDAVVVHRADYAHRLLSDKDLFEKPAESYALQQGFSVYRGNRGKTHAVGFFDDGSLRIRTFVPKVAARRRKVLRFLKHPEIPAHYEIARVAPIDNQNTRSAFQISYFNPKTRRYSKPETLLTPNTTHEIIPTWRPTPHRVIEIPTTRGSLFLDPATGVVDIKGRGTHHFGRIGQLQGTPEQQVRALKDALSNPGFKNTKDSNLHILKAQLSPETKAAIGLTPEGDFLIYTWSQQDGRAVPQNIYKTQRGPDGETHLYSLRDRDATTPLDLGNNDAKAKFITMPVDQPVLTLQAKIGTGGRIILPLSFERYIRPEQPQAPIVHFARFSEAKFLRVPAPSVRTKAAFDQRTFTKESAKAAGLRRVKLQTPLFSHLPAGHTTSAPLLPPTGRFPKAKDSAEFNAAVKKGLQDAGVESPGGDAIGEYVRVIVDTVEEYTTLSGRPTRDRYIYKENTMGLLNDPAFARYAAKRLHLKPETARYLDPEDILSYIEDNQAHIRKRAKLYTKAVKKRHAEVLAAGEATNVAALRKQAHTKAAEEITKTRAAVDKQRGVKARIRSLVEKMDAHIREFQATKRTGVEAVLPHDALVKLRADADTLERLYKAELQRKSKTLQRYAADEDYMADILAEEMKAVHLPEVQARLATLNRMSGKTVAGTTPDAALLASAQSSYQNLKRLKGQLHKASDDAAQFDALGDKKSLKESNQAFVDAEQGLIAERRKLEALTTDYVGTSYHISKFPLLSEYESLVKDLREVYTAKVAIWKQAVDVHQNFETRRKAILTFFDHPEPLSENVFDKAFMDKGDYHKIKRHLAQYRQFYGKHHELINGTTTDPALTTTYKRVSQHIKPAQEAFHAVLREERLFRMPEAVDNFRTGGQGIRSVEYRVPLLTTTADGSHYAFETRVEEARALLEAQLEKSFNVAKQQDIAAGSGRKHINAMRKKWEVSFPKTRKEGGFGSQEEMLLRHSQAEHAVYVAQRKNFESRAKQAQQGSR